MHGADDFIDACFAALPGSVSAVPKQFQIGTATRDLRCSPIRVRMVTYGVVVANVDYSPGARCRRAGLDGAAPRPRVRTPGSSRRWFAGEDAAYFYLRRKGYVVVARRWSPGHEPGDIDLIAWQGSLLCIVEVKTRTARDATPAEVAVDSHKRTKLRRLARQ